MSSKNGTAPEAAEQGSPAELVGAPGANGQDGDLLNLRGEDYSRDAAWADHSWQ
ncbi:hypothetical protein HER39_16695 [Arthrobacter deserti]|uniref:Uncharacterized protein n=1 Tax=Arthrobacter deserti TaxID=1742687 RepID=A0ABX1JTX3_9MICC|nr:hypothetical protein [Arthrobacter deserti]